MSGTKHWIDWRGLSDRRKAERLYPALARVGSLARLLDDELAKIGSALRSSSAIYGFDSWSYAEVTLAKREANIYIAKRSRDFGLEVWEHGILMANGSTPELSDVAAAIPLVLESTTRKISRLAREIGFLKFKRSARKYERGTYIEKRWQRMLRSEGWSRSGNEIFHWDDLGELIERAAEVRNFAASSPTRASTGSPSRRKPRYGQERSRYLAAGEQVVRPQLGHRR